MMSMWASLFVLHIFFRTSATTSLASQPGKGSKEVDITVQAETSETVIEFCNGRGCTFVGQVTSIYYHIKCQARTVERMGGEKRMQEIAEQFYKIKDLQVQRMHRNYLRTNDSKWSEMWALNGAVGPSLKVTEAWRRGYKLFFYGTSIDPISPTDGKQTHKSPSGSPLGVEEYAWIAISAVIFVVVCLCLRRIGNTKNNPEIFVTKSSNYNRIG